MILETNLSELLNKPKATLAGLRGARQIRLRRRGEEDLVLTTAARAEQDHTVLDATSRMFVELMRRPEGRTLVMDVLPATFPWVRYLPDHDVRSFAVELVDTVAAATAMTNTADVSQMLVEWRHTAEAYADPELHAALAGDVRGDHGPVPEPAAAT
jgi:hypothetical protein